jgi:hypothetical protein
MACAVWKGVIRGSARTGENGAGLLDVEPVVRPKDERDGAELQVEDGPAEGDPEGEEEDDGFGDEHVCIIRQLVGFLTYRPNR